MAEHIPDIAPSHRIINIPVSVPDNPATHFQDFETMLLNSGLNSKTAASYTGQAKKFREEFWNIHGNKEKDEAWSLKLNAWFLYRKIPEHDYRNQVKKDHLGNTVYTDKVEFYSKRWALFAIKHYMDYIGQGKVFSGWMKKHGRDIRARQRKLLNKALTQEELKKLFEALPYPMNTLMLLQYETAARGNELLSINKRQMWVNGDGSVQITVRVKGGKIRNLFVFNKDLIEMLRQLAVNAPDEVVFVDRNGVLNLDDYNYQLSKIGKEILGRNVTSHFIRHSKAVDIYNNTHDVLAVQTALGHQRLDTTEEYLKSAGVNTAQITRENPIKFLDNPKQPEADRSGT